jgi:hypothetical protein
MDSYLKLKLELVYKDLPIEQARSRFDELNLPPPPPPRRKIRIPGKK